MVRVVGEGNRSPAGLSARVGRLPRLALLEASARLGSFTAAGLEFGMSQPAVTRQIRLLETSLGLELFRRSANRVEVTDAGLLLADSVRRGLAELDRGIELLQRRSDAFVLACHPGFAQQWLVPRIEQLQAAIGGRELRLWLFDRTSDLDNGRYDAAIRVGDGTFSEESRPLFPETVVPVASPGLARAHRLTRRSTPRELLDSPLLHMDDGDQPWMSWSGWFSNFDTPLRHQAGRVLFNNYPMVLQQAVAGRGVALGWKHLIDDLLNDQVLVTVGPTVTTNNGYYLTWNAAAPAEMIRALCAWLPSQFAPEPDTTARTKPAPTKRGRPR